MSSSANGTESLVLTFVTQSSSADLSTEDPQSPGILERSASTTTSRTEYQRHPLDLEEPILRDDSRVSLYPIKYPVIMSLLDKQRAAFWLPHELRLVEDLKDWQVMSPELKHFIKMILAFFANSDLIVNENIEERFSRDVKALEIKLMFDFQKMMEGIHSQVYANLIDIYLEHDETEKTRLFTAVKSIESIKNMAGFVSECIESDLPFNERLIYMAAVEGIFFSGPFCAIFYLAELRIMTKLRSSNEFISRDEGMHVTGYVEVNKLLVRPASEATVHRIIRKAVDLQLAFICEALPKNLLGMNADLMSTYVKFIANRLVIDLGHSEVFPGATNPFPFMERILLLSKTNFFESKPTQYNLGTTQTGVHVDPFQGLPMKKKAK